MNSPNYMDLNLPFSGTTLNLRMGPEDYHARHSWNAGRHCNADFEIHILLSGSCTLEVGNQDIHFQPPKAMLIAPGTFHGPRNLSEDFERFCFSFMPTRQEFSQQLIDQVRTVAICSLPPEAIAICRLILAELSEGLPYAEDVVRAFFTQLLVIIFRRTHLEFSGERVPVNTATWRTTIIDKFFSPWPNAFGTEDELAAMLNLSRRQLNRILKETYGMTFRQKLACHRLFKAKRLLQTTTCTLSEIAEQCGYSSASSLSRAFRNYEGWTIGEMRRSGRLSRSTASDE